MSSSLGISCFVSRRIRAPTTDRIRIRPIFTRRPSGRRRSGLFRCSKAGLPELVLSPAETPFKWARPLAILIFPDDPLVGEQHCVVEEQAGTVLLSDLGSRTGVFVRIRGSQELLHGDELLVGRTRLVVDLGQ
ncbi:MAG: FHA domain-containing protein [Polyangiaceae bacterium]